MHGTIVKKTVKMSLFLFIIYVTIPSS